jgi:hypothetical protein
MYEVFQELGYYMEKTLKMGKTNVLNMNNSKWQRLYNNLEVRKIIYHIFL